MRKTLAKIFACITLAVPVALLFGTFGLAFNTFRAPITLSQTFAKDGDRIAIYSEVDMVTIMATSKNGLILEGRQDYTVPAGKLSTANINPGEYTVSGKGEILIHNGRIHNMDETFRRLDQDRLVQTGSLIIGAVIGIIAGIIFSLENEDHKQKFIGE